MDLPELDDLQFFDGVARSQTLTQAARRWGVSPSAVSKRLARLERRLGVQLVTRSTRRLDLTGEGERYAAGAARLLPMITDLEEEVGERRHGVRGRVAVHSTIGLGRAHIAPLLGGFRKLHPDIEIDLELSPLPLHVAGTPYDFAVRVGRQRDSALHARLLHPNRRVVCASPDYLRRRDPPRSVHDLPDHDCIVIRENDSDYAIWRFGTGAEEAAIKVPGAMISNDGEIATRWCADGHGLVMRSLWHVAPLLRTGELVQVLPDVPTPDAHIYAVYASARALPRRARLAIDHLATELRPRLA
ncbi:LysR family transcriptional regulator [Amycolatopsis sp. NPDC059021]|uniref:LysR family transcriptional regulator n=1 Tax=Amycolatopsis sp. NPDC059021 TaxID=3346704 RepID=UPI00367244C0